MSSLTARLERLSCELAAVKGRDPEQEQQERSLAAELRDVIGPALAAIAAQVERSGVPTDPTTFAHLLDGISDLEDDIFVTIAPDAIREMLAGQDKVRAAVEQARSAIKALPDRQDLGPLRPGQSLQDWIRQQRIRPYGQDRKLFQQLSGVSDRMLRQLLDRTSTALTAAAQDLGLAEETLQATFDDLLDNEMRRISRHVLRDAHETAVVETEKDLGVQWHMWRTAGDENVRDSHADADGEIVRVGERFSNGWRYPGLIGCRCEVEPWFPPAGSQPPAGRTRFTAADVA